VSLVLACSIIPLLSERYLTARDAEHAAPAPGAAPTALERLGRAIDDLAGRYSRTLGAVLGHPRRMVGVALALAVAGYGTYRLAESGFLPEMDEGAFVLDYWAPGGTALAETDRQLRVIDGILAHIPEVDGTSRRTGAELGLFATLQNRGDYVVRLKPESRRHRSSFEVIDDVRQKTSTALPRMRVEFVQILSDVVNDLDGSVGVRVRAPDAVRFDRLRLGAIPVLSPDGHGPVPVASVARFAPLDTRAELLRENQQQMILMTADLSARGLGSVMHDVKDVL